MKQNTNPISTGLRTEGLEKRLTSGPISFIELTRPRKFDEEYQNFVDQKESGELSSAFPIVNQNETILQVLNSLSGEYPNAVMIGDPGVGKSMTLEFIVDVITGKTSLDKVENWLPESVSLFKGIIKKLEGFENRDYLSVPNLHDPMNVEPFSFTKTEELDNAKEVLDEFFKSVNDYLNGFSSQRRKSLKREVNSLDDYKALIYQEVHKTVTNAMNSLATEIKQSKRRNPFNEIPILFAKINGNKFKNTTKNLEDCLEVNFNFENISNRRASDLGFLKNQAGYDTRTRGIKRNEIEAGLGRHFISKKIAEGLESVLNTLQYIEIGSSRNDEQEIDDVKKAKLLRETFNDYMEKLNKIHTSGSNKISPANIDLVNSITSNALSSRRSITPQISDGVLDEIRRGLDQIAKDFSSQTEDERIRGYMSRVSTYLASEEVIGSAIEEYLEKVEEIEAEHSIAVSQSRKKTGRQTIIVDPKQQKLSGNDEEFRRAIEKVQLEVDHGEIKYSLDELLEVKELFNLARSPGSLREVKVNKFTGSTICTISDIEDKMPYHKRISRLGPFFDGGILVFRDNFKAFVDYIVKGEDKTKTNSNLELMLEFLQNGKMTIEREDIRYTFEAPKMILGAGNEYPFIVVDDGLVRHISGLEDRISICNVPSFGRETPKGIVSKCAFQTFPPLILILNLTNLTNSLLKSLIPSLILCLVR